MRARPRTRTLLGIAAGATAAALLGATLSVPAQAGPIDRDNIDQSARKVDATSRTPQAIPDKWFVQVSGSPALRGGSRTAARARQADVREAASDAGVKYSVLNTFTRVWNGFSVKASKAEADRMLRLPGVTRVYPVFTVALPERVATPDLASSLPMIGADTVQASGYDGEGIKVGVIDTGIDYNHPDLGGSGVNDETADFMATGGRVMYGHDFVGDDYDADAGSGPEPDSYPDDCNGHGTHVAGTIGADGDLSTGGVKGVAPKVTLGAYRVFGCDGSSDTEVILAAMDAAAADDMDVVNMSLGSTFDTWPDYPDAAAVSALTAAGTLVVASVGNAGESGLFSSGSPSVGKDAISVASVENTAITNRYLTIAPAPSGTDGRFTFVPAAGAPTPPGSGTVPLTRASVQNGCEPLADLDGAIALIQRGTCNFYDKVINARDAAASGVVIYDDGRGVVTADLSGGDEITIPVVMISAEDGDALWTQLGDTVTTLTWNLLTLEDDNPLAGTVSDFSSFGMAADLTLTPDVAAPGGNIWSTYPLEQDGYANLSGTSMAAPHVAGAVALLLQAAPSLKGDVGKVRAALANTATPISDLYYFGDVIPGFYEPAIRQGAGLIHVDEAIAAATSATTVTPGKISLGENRSRYYKVRLKLTNNGTTTEKYKLSVQDAVNAGPSPTTYWYDYDTRKVSAKFSSRTVTVKAGRTATVSVRLKQPSLKTGWIYSGWVKLTRTDKAKTLVVPFAGMYGDYQKAKTMIDIVDLDFTTGEFYTYAELPALATSYDLADAIQDGDQRPTFSMVGDDVPHVLFHFDYPVSNAYFNVYQASSTGGKGAPVFSGYQTFLELGQWGRDDFYQYQAFDGKIPFSGSTSSGLTVPNGDYVIELKVLKALGSASRSSHWESWVSPAFTIDRTIG